MLSVSSNGSMKKVMPIMLIALSSMMSLAWASCDTSKRYCSDSGTFDSINEYQFFEGSISLFHTGFFTLYNEARSAFLNPNPESCSSSGYTPSQYSITNIYQVGNVENDWDDNTNSDTDWTYSNGNSPNSVDAFIGNIVSFQRCAYVFNFAYSSSSSTITYQV